MCKEINPLFFTDDGILGKMTAGIEGGQIIVEADVAADGDVTVTLRKKEEEFQFNQCPPSAGTSDSIQYTASMQSGQAAVTLDNQITQAGTYFIEATFTSLDGVPFEGDSVDLFYADTLTVYGTESPAGLVLCSDKEIVAKAEPRESDGQFPIGEQVAVESRSDLGINAFNTSQVAGTEFDAFTVYITDTQGRIRIDSVTGKPVDPGAVTITSSSGEEITVNRSNEDPYHVQALFRTAVREGAYRVSDALGYFGEVIVTVPETDPAQLAEEITEAGILPAAVTVVELQNAHGVAQVAVNPGPLTPDETFVTTLYEASFKLFDEFGNSNYDYQVQPFTEDDTGTFRVSSANAAQINHPSRGYGIPGRVNIDGTSDAAEIVYDAKGENAFAGEDSIKITFTKPGLPISGLSVTTSVPSAQAECEAQGGVWDATTTDPGSC
ncbi:MAG: hypothetical protein GY862_22435 [Gammaproteobacteria bacterium]|nr:hypothetical protein [Gammaproteobacteria bacterium]